MTEIKCRVANCNVRDDKELHLHHVIPRASERSDEVRIRLCKKHHNMIHAKMLSVLYRQIPAERRQRADDTIRGFTDHFCKDTI